MPLRRVQRHVAGDTGKIPIHINTRRANHANLHLRAGPAFHAPTHNLAVHRAGAKPSLRGVRDAALREICDGIHAPNAIAQCEIAALPNHARRERRACVSRRYRADDILHRFVHVNDRRIAIRRIENSGPIRLGDDSSLAPIYCQSSQFVIPIG